MPNTDTTPELAAAIAERIAAAIATGQAPDAADVAAYQATLPAPEPEAPKRATGRRPLRNFRYDEDAWQDVILLGELTDRNASEVVRDLLDRHVPAELEQYRPTVDA